MVKKKFVYKLPSWFMTILQDHCEVRGTTFRKTMKYIMLPYFILIILLTAEDGDASFDIAGKHHRQFGLGFFSIKFVESCLCDIFALVAVFPLLNTSTSAPSYYPIQKIFSPFSHLRSFSIILLHPTLPPFLSFKLRQLLTLDTSGAAARLTLGNIGSAAFWVVLVQLLV